MTDKQLRRLSRMELLEMLIQHSKEINRLQKELDEAHVLLKSKYIAIDNAGSIAEASLQLNGIFTAAQNAADQYLHNIMHKQNGGNAIDPINALLADTDIDSEDIDPDDIDFEIPGFESPDSKRKASKIPFFMPKKNSVASPLEEAPYADTAADEIIAETQTKRDEMITEAQTKHDEMITDAQSKHDEMIAEAQTKCDEMIAEAQTKCDEMIAEAQTNCDEMVRSAKEESQSWWAETSRKMDAFYRERVGLREMLAEQYKTSEPS